MLADGGPKKEPARVRDSVLGTGDVLHGGQPSPQLQVQVQTVCGDRLSQECHQRTSRIQHPRLCAPRPHWAQLHRHHIQQMYPQMGLVSLDGGFLQG